MRKMRNCAQLIFVARKMRKFAPTRKPVALETLVDAHSLQYLAVFFWGGRSSDKSGFRKNVSPVTILSAPKFP